MTSQDETDRALRIIREVADMLTDTGEGVARASALKQAATILERETQTCKFNCRTAKDSFKAGLERGVGFLPDGWEEEWKEYSNES